MKYVSGQSLGETITILLPWLLNVNSTTQIQLRKFENQTKESDKSSKLEGIEFIISFLFLSTVGLKLPGLSI